MFKFAFKAGLAAGAFYYISEQGVWKDSVETSKLCDKIGENVHPYVENVKSQLPFKVPDLPNSNRMSFVAKQYWNRGVSATFLFVGELPSHVQDWSQKGYSAVTGNPEVKNFLDSLSGAQESGDQKKK